MKLPRGVRLDHGYVQVRLFHDGVYALCKNFGPVSPESLDAAAKAYLEAKQRIREGKWGIKREAKAIKFKEARAVFYKRHYVDYRGDSDSLPRSKGSISVAGYNLAELGKYFDAYWLHDIGIKEIKAYKEECVDERGYAGATFNKHRMLLSSMFVQFRAWGTEKAIEAVRLPEDDGGNFLNPCAFVATLSENKRNRVPTIEELKKAHLWCVENDQELWYAIEMALLTALRKSDLIGLTGEVKGVQKKTGEGFSLPVTIGTAVQYSRVAWNRLRSYMGWLPEQPNHTTWHDLRHWAPTLLGVSGFTGKQIQSYTSHKSEDALARYINVKSEHVPQMLEQVKRQLAAIKGGQ